MLPLLSILNRPWPWYIAGPIIGLMVPWLLIAGNKLLGVSSSLQDICAACIPRHIESLRYDWKKNSWNIVFVAGILLGGFLAGWLFPNPLPLAVSSRTVADLQRLHIAVVPGLLPAALFNWSRLLTWQGLTMMVGGGFLVGFGTRYAGGCTSGHGIMGLSSLQWPSLIAVMAFFAGGICCTYLILPYILR
jgi:uncharacterized membrane protein YedE/YeeE